MKGRSFKHAEHFKEVKDNLRYEIKVVLRACDYGRLTSLLKRSIFPIRKLHPPRRVQSIYLDTHEGKALHENLAGISQRKKVRFRWYGYRSDYANGQLELKTKTNMLGRKHRLPLGSSIPIEGTSRLSFIRQLREQSSPDWCALLDQGLEPAQWIRYEREYFSLFSNQARITIDRKVKASDLRIARNLSFETTTPLPDIIIIECKASYDNYDLAKSFIESLPLLADKCSKYVLASSPANALQISSLRG